ncbi:MAG: serine/threonine protein kinase [Candidatus Melainabacteria bacterium]|nr:serine/threonine protein kinase [Candidatus Melainabacteria bacterium]
MAELELCIPYKSKACQVGVVATAALMPLWGIAIPFFLGLLTSQIIQHPHQIPAIVAFALIIALIAIPAFAIVLAAIFEDDLIVVSREGIAFPLRMLPNLAFKRERSWHDLKFATLSSADSGKGSTDRLLGLNFGNGGSVVLKLKDMERTDLEQMLLAIEIWGENCNRTQDLIEFQNDLQNENLGLTAISYTKMWEEELSRRFSNTSFIPLKPGTTLQEGRLAVIRQLAFGGLSAIYLVQLKGSELVVLKEAVIPGNSDSASREKAQEMFEREAKLLVRLSHPYIARVLDHFRENERHYLLLEYIRGQDLRQLVSQKGPQSQQEVVQWGIQIADILSYLHSQSPAIIHRDLTPDNLVLGHDHKPVLIDFGAANEFVGTATGTLVGKQAYIAPEQLRGKACPASDIYAMGGTLFYLLTGQDPEALMVSHPRDINQDIDEDLDSLVAQCMSMEVAERPENPARIKESLEAIAARIGTAPPASVPSTESA